MTGHGAHWGSNTEGLVTCLQQNHPDQKAFALPHCSGAQGPRRLQTGRNLDTDETHLPHETSYPLVRYEGQRGQILTLAGTCLCVTGKTADAYQLLRGPQSWRGRGLAGDGPLLERPLHARVLPVHTGELHWFHGRARVLF